VTGLLGTLLTVDAETVDDLATENGELRRRVGELESERRRRTGSQRDRLLAAAADSFAAVGFASATTRSIARSAGVSPTAITAFFEDKAGLYDAVLQQLRTLELNEIERLRSRHRAGDFDGLGAARRFEVVFTDWVEFHLNHPEICRVELHRLIEADPLDGPTPNQLLPSDDASLDAFTELVGVDHDRDALRVLFLIANDLILTWVGGAPHHASALGMHPQSTEYRNITVATIVDACAQLRLRQPPDRSSIGDE